MKYLKVLLFLFFIAFFGSEAFGANLVYPIQEMSKPECRFQKFSTLGPDCIMQLPILKTADYTKYKNDYSLYRRVYTVLWAGSYTYGWDTGLGGHQGVDIATAAGTPIYAVTDGKVVVASNLAGRGNVVKIEHIINSRKVYSNYAHMSKIDVKVGDIVKPLTKIGEVGSTGNSTGNHLHFQIDIGSANGPWYWKTCKVKDYDTIVNTAVCFDELNQNTIDPLLFLETNGAIVKPGTIVKPEQEVISQEGLISNEEIRKREIKEFLNIYNIKIDIIDFGKNIEVGKAGTLRIQVTNKRNGKLFNGSFPGDMNFKYDGGRMTLFPTGVFQIDNGFRDIKVTPKIAGKMSIDIYIGETFLKKVSFGAFDTKKPIIPKTTVFGTTASNVIGENKKGVFYFKDTNSLNILGMPFSGKYILTSEGNNVKFCIKKASSLNELKYIFNSSCKEDYFRNSLEFDTNSATSGIILFEYKILTNGPVNIKILSGNNTIGSKTVNGIYSLGLTKEYPYYEEINFISKLGIPVGINKGYFLQDKEITHEESVYFIKNSLNHLLTNCKDNSCKNLILNKLSNINALSTDRYKSLTRYEFFEMLNNYLPISDYNGSDSVVFRDLDVEKQKIVKNIFKSLTWKDNYGATRYFQPNKNITRGEAAFLIYNLINSGK